MRKISDRVVLGLIAGLVGNVCKTAIDEVSIKAKISQRSFRETAAGVWVNKRKEATHFKGQLLGGLFDFGMSSVLGIGTVYFLSKTGKDHAILKGLTTGMSGGSAITALLSAFPQNKVKPKDAASNLSYMLSHAVYGVVTASVAAWLGEPSLFGPDPINDGISEESYFLPVEEENY